MIAVLGDKKKLRLPRTIANDKVADVVRELFQEEEEALLVKVKEDLKTSLKTFVEMEKTFKQKEDEIAKLKVEKKKDFVKVVETLFGKIADIGALEKSYAAGLNVALEGGSEE